MKRSLVSALFLNDRIKTIESRAKEIRPDVDKIITWAKKGDLHSRRLAIAALGGDKELVREVFEKVEQGMFAGSSGRLHPHHEAGQPQGRQRPHGHHGARDRAGAEEAEKADEKPAPRRLLRRRSRLSRSPRPRKLLRLSRLLRRRLKPPKKLQRKRPRKRRLSS